MRGTCNCQSLRNWCRPCSVRRLGAVVSSEPERSRRILSAGVLVFRWASFAWMTLVNLTASEPFRHSILAWALVAAAGAFTLWVTVARNWDRPVVLVVDLTLSCALIVLSGYVVQTGQVVGGRLFFATAYPVSTALAWGAARGPLVGLGAAAVLGVAGVFSRPLNGVPLGDLDTGQIQSLVNGAVNYALAAVAAGVVSRVLTRTSEEVRAASEVAIRERERAARLAERESLARAIHDSVLQALAHIHKRGRELGSAPEVPGAEVRRLAEMAAEQESALRSLILRKPAEAPTGTASLRDRLEEVARGTTGVPVTVSAVGPIWLPAAAVEQLAAAVQQALDNVAGHAEASRVSVFAESEAGWVVVSVRDDGRGFDYDEDEMRAAGKVGMLHSMKGRIEELGGHMRVETAPGAGTEVEFRVPLADGDPGADR
jgi:signal transduction histidine kinase